MNDKRIIKGLAMISQIGISIMVPIFLCGGIGYWLSHQFSNEIFFPVFLVLGIGAAFRSIYVLTKSFYAADMKREHEQQEYLANLKNYHKEHPDEDFSDVMEAKKKRYPDLKNPVKSKTDR